MSKFGKYLKDLRSKQQLSLRQVEGLTGVSNAYICQLETGKRKKPPNLIVLSKLAEVYKVSLFELVLIALNSKTK